MCYGDHWKAHYSGEHTQGTVVGHPKMVAERIKHKEAVEDIKDTRICTLSVSQWQVQHKNTQLGSTLEVGRLEGRAMIGSGRQNTPCIPTNVKLSMTIAG